MSYSLQYRKVKNVFSNFTAGDINKVLVTGRRIYATDGRIIVSTPFDTDLEFLVDGAKFGGSITRKGATLRLDNGTLVVEAEKSVDYLPSGSISERVRPKGEWVALPSKLLIAFEALREFQSDDVSREWACAITARQGHLFATNNFIFAVWKDDELGDLDVAFPSWLVEYVLDINEQPSEMCLHNDWVGLRWNDGTEILAYRLSREMQDKATSIGLGIELVGEELPKGWKDCAFEAISFVGCETVTITPNEIIAVGREDKRIVKCESPTTKESHFDPKLLRSVLSLATHMDLDASPAPSTWYGNNVRGLIASKVT